MAIYGLFQIFIATRFDWFKNSLALRFHPIRSSHAFSHAENWLQLFMLCAMIEGSSNFRLLLWLVKVSARLLAFLFSPMVWKENNRKEPLTSNHHSAQGVPDSLSSNITSSYRILLVRFFLFPGPDWAMTRNVIPKKAKLNCKEKQRTVKNSVLYIERLRRIDITPNTRGGKAWTEGLFHDLELQVLDSGPPKGIPDSPWLDFH